MNEQLKKMDSVDPELASSCRFDIAYIIDDVRAAIKAFRKISKNLSFEQEAYKERLRSLDSLLDPRAEWQRLYLPLRRNYIAKRLSEIGTESCDIDELIEGVDLSLQQGNIVMAETYLNQAIKNNPFSVFGT